jgi:Fe-S-cluster-containing dehydrogenase component
MYIEQDKDACKGCAACVAFCKRHHNGVAMSTFEKGVNEFINCSSCKDLSCIRVCPTGAMHLHFTGVPVVDEDTCVGCGYCVDACRNHIPQLIDGKAAKCDLCVDRQLRGELPWCIKACRRGRLKLVDGIVNG